MTTIVALSVFAGALVYSLYTNSAVWSLLQDLDFSQSSLLPSEQEYSKYIANPLYANYPMALGSGQAIQPMPHRDLIIVQDITTNDYAQRGIPQDTVHNRQFTSPEFLREFAQEWTQAIDMRLMDPIYDPVNFNPHCRPARLDRYI